MPEKLYMTGEVAKIFGVSYVALKKWAIYGARSNKKQKLLEAVENAIRYG